jgi:hypothetical protein
MASIQALKRLLEIMVVLRWGFAFLVRTLFQSVRRQPQLLEK